MYTRAWLITVKKNGFTFKVLVSGTEQDMRNYIDSELPDWKNYVGASENDIKAAQMLDMPIYLA